MSLSICASAGILLQVEVGNPHVVWSASEDGTLRQHDFREGASCPPAGNSQQECRNVLVSIYYVMIVVLHIHLTGSFDALILRAPLVLFH